MTEEMQRVRDVSAEHVEQWAEDKALAPYLQAIAKAESGFDPRAESPAGAQGLMQLMPAIQRHFEVTDPFDPKESVRAGEALLREEIERFKDLQLALAAYNAGSPAVYRAMKEAQSTRWENISLHLPRETREYVPKVLGFASVFLLS
jgi:soluble lytic murein transglycosylase-like protein